MRALGMATLIVDRSQLALMKDPKELLEQLLETLDVMSDKRLLRDIDISRTQGKEREDTKLSQTVGGIRA